MQLGDVVSGTCLTPDTESQLSMVQGSPSSVATGLPGWQVPVAHWSGAVQALLSLQAVPSALFGLEQVPVD